MWKFVSAGTAKWWFCGETRVQKKQTSEKRYKVSTKALPPMRDFASLLLGNYCTFVCGTLFARIKLMMLYPRQ
jgi:hypothetical protein